ncbi:hypothetical protein FQR65_LT10749 [Abscondita terminalis]|nr:hypothetical protein FQR65_LT10749 [Abscondita terminalis]
MNAFKWVIFCAVFIVFITILFFVKPKNNVCTTFDDYYGSRLNNCYYNPDGKLNVSHIIVRWGYDLEEYTVTTEDGYILLLVRIPYGKNTTDVRARRPVFLQHGLLMNSVGFVNRGRKSLGFILVDAGYDVWLGNLRGTMYSKKHKHLDPQSAEFWDFDIMEMGIYDVPAMIDFIYKKTNQQIIYIGHSLGTTVAFIYGTTWPTIAQDKIRVVVSLAPTIYIKNWNSFITYITPIWKYLQPIVLKFTNGEVYLRGKPQSSVRENLCTIYPFQMYVCQLTTMLGAGFDYEQNDPETLPITILQNVDSISHKIITYIIQKLSSGGFEYFDYGVDKNMQIYGSPTPPRYNVSALRIPNYFIRATNDWMNKEENVDLLSKELSKEANPYDVYVIKHKYFNHDDFFTARDVVPLLYNHILEFLECL